MPRLHRVRSTDPGIERSRHGRGFTYRDARGKAIHDDETLSRIRALAIPPAWSDVWIGADPQGHLQAVGTDDAGRRQYLYHPAWRDRRDTLKFHHVEEFASALPDLRRRVDGDIHRRGMPRERVLACAVRLLDDASFRIGSETYAERNGSFGLATLRKSHVELERGRVVFDYKAKSGVRRVQTVRDPDAVKVVRSLKTRKGGGGELLAYRQGSRWVDVRSSEINEYLKETAGDDVSAKDFRTWQATILAAVKLAAAEAEMTPVTSRRRIWSGVVREVADHLGNTPAVARGAYIDPRVFERFQEGITIAARLRDSEIDGSLDDARIRTKVEAAVLALLRGELAPAVQAA